MESNLDVSAPAIDRVSPRVSALGSLAAITIAALALSACHGPEPRLVIVARSDLAPREEVDRIDVALVGVSMSTSTTVARSAELREGITVFDRQLASLAGRHVRVTFFFDGEEIAMRDLVFDHLADREIVVDLPRLCVDVVCDDGETCIVGQCASTACVEGDEADCPEAMCDDDGQCAVEDVPCATGVCANGACLAYGDDEGCEAHEWCDPLSGCAPRRAYVDAWVAMPDGGGVDAYGPDAGADGGELDAAVDVDAAEEEVDAALEGI
jgi:hypothetical protein